MAGTPTVAAKQTTGQQQLQHRQQLQPAHPNAPRLAPAVHASCQCRPFLIKCRHFYDNHIIHSSLPLSPPCCSQALHTFGFRGEALSSLAALGDLSVITRTADQAAANRLEFDRDGHLTSTTPVARAVGTTVALKELFAPLPVRRQVRRP